MRVRPTDIADSIFVPSVRQKVDPRLSEDDERHVVVYTMFGSHDYLDENNHPVLMDEYYDEGEPLPAEERDLAYAKAITINDNPTRFYVKQGSNGKFYNPIGMYTEGRHTKQLKHAGRAEWEFREVNRKVFGFYLNFLKSKNVAQLTNAEREAF